MTPRRQASGHCRIRKRRWVCCHISEYHRAIALGMRPKKLRYAESSTALYFEDSNLMIRPIKSKNTKAIRLKITARATGLAAVKVFDLLWSEPSLCVQAGSWHRLLYMAPRHVALQPQISSILLARPIAALCSGRHAPIRPAGLSLYLP